jgi:hypothetical protein
MPRSIVTFAPKTLADEDLPPLGTEVNESHYDVLIDADESQLMAGKYVKLRAGDYIKVYKPDIPATRVEEERLLLCLVKDALPQSLCDEVRPVIRKAAHTPVAGGQRAGPAGLKQDYQLHADGTPSKMRGTPRESQLTDPEDRRRLVGTKEGQVGSNPRGVKGGKVYPCRLTYWTKTNLGGLEKAVGLTKAVNEIFRLRVPDRYDNQLGKTIETSKEFVLADKDGHYTVFTTITTNLSWQTFTHTDKKDLKEGFGVTMALGNFKGCHLVFPKYRVAVKHGERDVVLADVHEMHGQTKLLNPDGSLPQEGNLPERLACVFYYQENMNKCLNTFEEEAESVGRRQPGDKIWLNRPKE